MRHKVIEEMFRSEYCMRDCDQVNVIFLANDEDNIEEYMIEDYVYHDGHTTLRRSILKVGIIHQEITSLD